jgi:hypothetical protein
MAEALKMPRPPFRFSGVIKEFYNGDILKYRLNLSFAKIPESAATVKDMQAPAYFMDCQEDLLIEQNPPQALPSHSITQNAEPVILTKAQYCDLRQRVFNIDSAQKVDEETENAEWFLALSPEAQQDLRAGRAGLCSIEPGTNPLFLALEPQLQAAIQQQYEGVDEYGMCPNGKPFEIEVEQ